MNKSSKEKVIPVNQLPGSLQVDCLFPRVIPMITYRANGLQPVILNVKCKSIFCLKQNCPLKEVVDFK
jgi:hypothetical protein